MGWYVPAPNRAITTTRHCFIVKDLVSNCLLASTDFINDGVYSNRGLCKHYSMHVTRKN